MGIEGMGTQIEKPVVTLAQRSLKRMEVIAEQLGNRVSEFMSSHPKDMEALSKTAEKIAKRAGKLAETVMPRLERALEKPLTGFAEVSSRDLQRLSQKLTPQFMEDLGKVLDKTAEQVRREINTKGFEKFVTESAEQGGEALVALLRLGVNGLK